MLNLNIYEFCFWLFSGEGMFYILASKSFTILLITKQNKQKQICRQYFKRNQ